MKLSQANGKEVKMSDNDNWRKFMDPKWKELKDRANQPQSQHDILNTIDPLEISTTTSDLLRSINKTTERIAELDKRQVKRADVVKKHTMQHIREIASNKSSVVDLGNRKVALRKVIPQTKDPKKLAQLKDEYFNVNERLDAEWKAKMKHMEKDIDKK